MTNNISDTRTGVTDVKTFIDGMRSSRDTKMADMTSLKTQLKDQNERMIKVTQDKAKLEAKNKARQLKVRCFLFLISLKKVTHSSLNQNLVQSQKPKKRPLGHERSLHGGLKSH